MKKTIFLLSILFFLFINFNGYSQSLHFSTTEHDFGTIKEDDGPVTFTFAYTNTGTKKLIITKVAPTCACTTAKWIGDSLAEGKGGGIDVSFNPKNRGGTFNKSIAVYSNNLERSILIIRGHIIPHGQTTADSYPYKSGSLRFKTTIVRLPDLQNNIADTFQYLYVTNTSDSNVIINSLDSKGATYIYSNNLPFVLLPHLEAKFPIHYRPNLVNDYGTVINTVLLSTTDQLESIKAISIMADIHPYFPKPSVQERESMPQIFFTDSIHDFGNIKQGDTVSFNFLYQNNGKKELRIYTAKSSCGCTVSVPEKLRLQSGESSSVKVTFDSRGKNGQEEKSVTVYSNDPINPEYILRIKSNVLPN